MAAVASFSYKIGGGGLIFLENWRRRQGFGNITGGCSDMVWILVSDLIFLQNQRRQPVIGNITGGCAAVLTWSGYWEFWHSVFNQLE